MSNRSLLIGKHVHRRTFCHPLKLPKSKLPKSRQWKVSLFSCWLFFLLGLFLFMEALKLPCLLVRPLGCTNGNLGTTIRKQRQACQVACVFTAMYQCHSWYHRFLEAWSQQQCHSAGWCKCHWTTWSSGAPHAPQPNLHLVGLAIHFAYGESLVHYSCHGYWAQSAQMSALIGTLQSASVKILS